MRALGVIPARGGSRGILRKNLAPLCGRPLLAHTCEAALQSRALSHVLLSTDDSEIAEVGRSLGVDVPFLRPSEISGPDATMIDVLSHVLSWCRQTSFALDVIVLLQPTSPLRRPRWIDVAVDLLEEKAADSVVSVRPVPHHFAPDSLLRREPDGSVRPLLDGPAPQRRQDKPKLLARNGPAVLAVRRDVIERGDLYGDRIWPLEMPAWESVDIDDPADLALAEFWLTRQPQKEEDG